MTQYLGKLSKEDRKFFGSQKTGKAIKDSDRVKKEKKPVERNLPIRGE